MLAFYSLWAPQPKARLQGFALAVKSFELNPSSTAFVEIVNAARYPRLRQKVGAYCRKYLEDFEKNKDTYVKKDGYRIKLAAARISADYLRTVNRKDKNLIASYKQKIQEFQTQDMFQRTL